MAPIADYNDRLEVVTEEVVICKLLTSNDLKVRNRGISSLKKWFQKIGLKNGVKEDDFNRIWNGLFYYVWMSDKPLVQEEAVECISSMMHLIENYQSAMYYIRGFFNSLVNQWDRISHYRIDKFLMFVRRFLRQILILLKNHNWETEKLELFSKELYNALQILPYSLALHLNEIFTEEVAKISKGEVTTDTLVLLLKGFLECIADLRPSMQIVNSINNNVFGNLVRQLKLHINQKALSEHCDKETNNENSESDEDAVNTSALDPRPGGVDVFLPYIAFDEKVFVKFIQKYVSKPELSKKAKNILNQMIAMFSSISRLRTSVNDTDKLMREIQDHPKKRKRPKEKMTKLIKQYCQRLEDEEEAIDRNPKKLTNTEKLIRALQRYPTKRKCSENSSESVKKSCRKLEQKKKTKKVDWNWVVENVAPKDEDDEKSSDTLPIEDIDYSDIHEIIVSNSVVKENPELMKKGHEYVIVDFKKDQLDSQKDGDDEQKPSDNAEVEVIGSPKWKTIDSSVVLELASKCTDDDKLPEESTVTPKKQRTPRAKKTEVTTRVLRNRRIEPMVEIEKLEETPQKTKTSSRRNEKLEGTPQKTEVSSQRKSLRIAEKRKKVMFKLEENTYQDIPSYKKDLELKPESPFNGSKLPANGILKPFAVTTPINPFYFTDGERKLKRKRK